jgi:hypothetical protein
VLFNFLQFPVDGIGKILYQRRGRCGKEDPDRQHDPHSTHQRSAPDNFGFRAHGDTSGRSNDCIGIIRDRSTVWRTGDHFESKTNPVFIPEEYPLVKVGFPDRKDTVMG